MSKAYIGRFAPSPSGPLHMGSLVCALASFLDAKAHQGQWLIRIEDIDPPREMPGATHEILAALQAHALISTQEVTHQSARTSLYLSRLKQLEQHQAIYYCQCSRKLIREQGVHNNQYCREQRYQHGAIRLDVNAARHRGLKSNVTFTDRFCGHQEKDLGQCGDFIIHRKDGLFSYQLAVVADDIDQGITDVVRGDDLLASTFGQVFLFHLLHGNNRHTENGGTPPVPRYAHIPVVLGSDGHKLSKQSGAPPIDNAQPVLNLTEALRLLGFQPPELTKIREVLAWALEAWSLRYNIS